MGATTLLAGPLAGVDLAELGDPLPKVWNPFELAGFVSDLRELLVDPGEPMAMWIGPHRPRARACCPAVMRMVLKRPALAQHRVAPACTAHGAASVFLLGVERPSCPSPRWFPACEEPECYDDLANLAVAMVVVQLAAGLRSKLDRLSW